MGSRVELPSRMDTWQDSMAVSEAVGIVLPPVPGESGAKAAVAARCRSCTNSFVLLNMLLNMQIHRVAARGSCKSTLCLASCAVLRDTQTKAVRQTDKYTQQTDRRMDRQTGRQTNRQTGRHSSGRGW